MVKELVVDLRGKVFESQKDFWNALMVPCGLPVWFGKNPDAWRDVVVNGGISEVIGAHDAVIVHVDRTGYFTRNDRDMRALKRSFAGRQSKLVIHREVKS
jgi:Barstar (barnase inhibitor)